MSRPVEGSAERNATGAGEPAGEDDLALAREAALEAGVVLQRTFGTSLAVRYKSADQPVTEADLKANEILRAKLTRGRPGYGWLSEETFEAPDLDTDTVWVVDPLDGTANFVAGRPEFAICVGLLQKGTPVLGVVYNPITGDVFHGLAGQGSFRNGEPIRARPAGRDGLVLVASTGELERGLYGVVPEGWSIERLGSTSLKTMRVAEGGADLYLSRSPKGIWDLVAPLLIASEAGASAWRLDGRALDLAGLGPQRGLIVSGPAAEQEIPGFVRLLGDSSAIETDGRDPP